MNILINCSNLKNGGGLQVGDSICRALKDIKNHKFVVVLSSHMDETADLIKNYENCKVIRHDIRNDIKTLLFGRDFVLDNAVKRNKIDVVLTVFGPSRWSPRCKHLCGFARAQLIMRDSPYYKRMPLKRKIREKIINKIWDLYFKRGAGIFYTENPLTTELLQKHWPRKKVHTVTNYYNQIFDEPSRWISHNLTKKNCTTILSVTSSGEWKNLGIMRGICTELKRIDPNFEFCFVITIRPEQYGPISEEIKDRFEFTGPVPINELPSLYEQVDILFQPTLLECFTATFPEAMRMRIPIVTTNLDFARGLCGDAAEYYSAVDSYDAAIAIYNVAKNKDLRARLVKNGQKQLMKFDTYNDRARKLISLCENL